MCAKALRLIPVCLKGLAGGPHLSLDVAKVQWCATLGVWDEHGQRAGQYQEVRHRLNGTQQHLSMCSLYMLGLYVAQTAG